MPDEASRRADWCDRFATLYAAREQCSPAHSRFVARMLYPYLSLLTPAQAMQTLPSDPTFGDSMRDMDRRANGDG